MKIICILFLTLSLCIAHGRSWTGTNGNTIDAEIISIKGDIIKLKENSSRRVYDVNCNWLSKKDNELIELIKIQADGDIRDNVRLVYEFADFMEADEVMYLTHYKESLDAYWWVIDEVWLKNEKASNAQSVGEIYKNRTIKRKHDRIFYGKVWMVSRQRGWRYFKNGVSSNGLSLKLAKIFLEDSGFRKLPNK